MTFEEKQELDALKTELQRIKLTCYSYMESLDKADEKQLRHSGYNGKTNAEAMQAAFQHYKAEIKKLINAHVKKYPDI